MKDMVPGKIVFAVDSFHGSYIGKVTEIRSSPASSVQIKILACLSYPRQHSEFFKDKHVERKPYPYLSIQTFSVRNIGKWVGYIPEYTQSVSNAVNLAIKNCRPLELQILIRHSNRLEGGFVCAG